VSFALNTDVASRNSIIKSALKWAQTVT
jgi:hypothetical protein